MAVSTTDWAQKERQIQDMDLDRVRKLVMKTYGWDDASADQAVSQYRDFLWVCWRWWSSEHTERLAGMGWIADLVWHCHMLMPDTYISDCERVFGQGMLLDHDPFFDDRELPGAVRDAREAYREAGRQYPAMTIDDCQWSVVGPRAGR